MAENLTYKIVTGTVAEIENQINELATHGWRVVSWLAFTHRILR